MSTRPHIGFSTLACPGWSFEEVLAHAQAWDLQQIEMRLLDGRVVTGDLDRATIERVTQLAEGAGINIPTLATSLRLSHGPVIAEEASRLFNIAAAWGCRQLRVFGGPRLDGVGTAEYLERATAGVRAILPLAHRTGIAVAIETHDSLSATSGVVAILEEIGDPLLGVIWDVVHTAADGETALQTWDAIGPHVVEIQVKDAKITAGAVEPVLLDMGEVRWRDALAVAHRNGFSGPLMLEWEKAWHKEIVEPEIATPYELAMLRTELRNW
jgi:sugar phosphate isomerase/epimerase